MTKYLFNLRDRICDWWLQVIDNGNERNLFIYFQKYLLVYFLYQNQSALVIAAGHHFHEFCF